MKLFIIALIFFAVSACAEIVPSMVSPSVYRSREKNIVSGHEAEAEWNKREKKDQMLLQERNYLRNKKAIEEIGNNKVFADINGVPGGFPVIFENKTKFRIHFVVEKIDERIHGKWSFDLDEYSYREFKLEKGKYIIRFTSIKKNKYFYEQTIKGRQARMEVFSVPNFYSDLMGKTYFGGCIFLPE